MIKQVIDEIDLVGPKASTSPDISSSSSILMFLFHYLLYSKFFCLNYHFSSSVHGIINYFQRIKFVSLNCSVLSRPRSIKVEGSHLSIISSFITEKPNLKVKEDVKNIIIKMINLLIWRIWNKIYYGIGTIPFIYTNRLNSTLLKRISCSVLSMCQFLVSF